MKRLLTFAMAAAFAVPVIAQTAAPARVAVIDVRRVLSDSKPGKAAFERLKKKQDDLAARAQKMNEEVTSLEAQYNQKKLSMSEDKLIDLQKQASDKKIALQRYAQDAERDMTETRDKALGELEKLILPVITGIGKEMGFAAIFNKYESGLVYASDAIDITDVVVKRFNETSSPAGAPAPTPAAPTPKK